MKIKRMIALLLTVCMLLPLASCAGSSPTVMTLENIKFTEAMYSYWASSYKGRYLDTYSDITDSAEFWKSEFANGQTVAEYLDSATLDGVKMIIVNSYLFNKYRLAFTKDEEQSIDDYISDLITEIAGGSKNDLNAYLGTYGINVDILRKIYLEEEKAAKVYDHLYGDKGISALTDADFEKFYKENYVRVQMIYVENISGYKLDDDGNRVTDETGQFIVEPLTGEAKEEKDAIVKAVEDGIANGEDFNKLYEEYSELKYKNGAYFSAADSYDDTFYYELVANVETAEIGEIVTMESEMGTCIMKKLELDDGAWKNEINTDFFSMFKDTANQTSYQKLVESYYDKIVIDESIVKKYSIVDVIPAYI